MAVQEFRLYLGLERLPKAERPLEPIIDRKVRTHHRRGGLPPTKAFRRNGRPETGDERPAGHSRLIASETHVSDLSLNKISPPTLTYKRGKKS